MPSSSDAIALVGKFQVSIKGKRLSSEADAAVISITVSEDLEVPGMFVIEMSNWDMLKGSVSWSDSDLLDIGNQVEIQMGYQGNLKTLISGEITGLEPEFDTGTGSIPTVIARGYDLRHRLLRGRKTRTFTNMTDSNIASQIAREQGLLPKVKDSKVKLEHVLQANQTDMEFLQERSGRIGYEIYVEEKNLYFQPHQNKSQKVLTLKLGEDIIEFSPRLSTMGQVGEVEVHSWDPKQKKVLVGKAGVGNETTTMGGTASGPKEAKKAFGKGTYSIVREPVSSQAEADQIAKAQYNEMALDYITGEGTCRGKPELRAGTTIEITGVGKRFSGEYYVTAATHTISHDLGYRTEFSVRRNAT